RQTRGNAKAREPDLAGRRVYQDMGWLNIFVDETPRVELTQRTRQADGDTQKLGHFPWLSHKPRQELTAGIPEQERGPSFAAHQLQGPRRPGRVELLP